MENLLTRYRNVSILVGVLFLQVLGLAIQVKRKSENESTRLIRIWTVTALAPLEKGIVGLGNGTSNIWHNYIYLRGVRQENRELKEEIQQMQLKQVRLTEDAQQARRLQALLGFKEQFIAQTLPAQVIGSGGTQQSRIIYIDKGEHDGVKAEMPVITANGIVGKILRVYRSTSQVLLINDQTSGAGAILEKSRMQGVVQGTPTGEVMLTKIMSDEQVQVGEHVLTSGGDQVFPKGLPIGTVTQVSNGKDSFLNVKIRPAADLSKLEEVLVITKKEDRVPSPAETGPISASDILSARLPTVPVKPAPDKLAGEKKNEKIASEPPGAARVAPGVNAPQGSATPSKTAKNSGTPQPANSLGIKKVADSVQPPAMKLSVQRKATAAGSTAATGKPASAIPGPEKVKPANSMLSPGPAGDQPQ